MPRKKQVAGWADWVSSLQSRGLFAVGVLRDWRYDRLTADDEESRERPAFEGHCENWKSRRNWFEREKKKTRGKAEVLQVSLIAKRVPSPGPRDKEVFTNGSPSI